MRVTKEKVAEHRRAILDTAARLFRERGVADVGVAEIMQASGLTHGAFYGHFRSKDELASEACREACAQGLERWERTPDLSLILDRYLSPDHRDNPAKGCSVSAFANEAARLETGLRENYTEGLEGFVAFIEERLPVDDTAQRRQKAIAVFSAMVGALTMSRGVVASDPKLSDEILAKARHEIRSLYGV